METYNKCAICLKSKKNDQFKTHFTCNNKSKVKCAGCENNIKPHEKFKFCYDCNMRFKGLKTSNCLICNCDINPEKGELCYKCFTNEQTITSN